MLKCVFGQVEEAVAAVDECDTLINFRLVKSADLNDSCDESDGICLAELESTAPIFGPEEVFQWALRVTVSELTHVRVNCGVWLAGPVGWNGCPD